MKPAPTRAPKMGRELLRSIVHRLRTAFYPETLGASAVKARPFYEDLQMLRRAATWPAKFIRDNGTGEFDAARYEEIFEGLIREVKVHASAPEQMRRRGAYILHCVQDHWRHNWERYAPESKSAAAAVARELRECERRGETQGGSAPRAIAVLAAAHDALTLRKPQPRAKKLAPKKPARETQSELF